MVPSREHSGLVHAGFIRGSWPTALGNHGFLRSQHRRDVQDLFSSMNRESKPQTPGFKRAGCQVLSSPIPKL